MVDVFVPKYYSTTHTFPKWFSKELKNRILEKNRLHKIYNQQKNRDA